MLKILLILFIVAIALAPLMHFLPSKQQKKIARLREYAAVHGLFVEFRDTPGAPPAREHAGRVIYYGKRLPATCSDRIETAAWANYDEEWRSIGRRLPVPAFLADLTVELLAVSVDEFSCGVYWTESGEEDAVEQIRSGLESWSAALAG